MKTPDQITQEFEEELKKSSWWSRFLGSQFVTYLSGFIGQIIHRCAHAASRGLQESFLSLATRRASILAAAEDRAYVGLKISPSTGLVTITNRGLTRLSLTKNTPCIAQNQTEYLLTDVVDLEPSKSADCAISQLWLETLDHTVSHSTAWFSLLLSRDMTALTHKIDVYVDGQQWENRFKFRNTTPESQCYMEYYKATDQLGIRFGNGVNGQIPTEGSKITLKVWCTNGETTLIDAQPLQLTQEDPTVIESAEIITKTPIIGGAPGDDIESIRNGSLYTTSYDNQIAWDSDYVQFIRLQIGGIVWLSVWGEAQQEKLTGYDEDNINRIFISAYSDVKNDEKLSQEILALFDGREGYNEHYTWVTRVDQPFTLSIVAYTYLTSKPSDAEIYLRDKLNQKYGKNVKKKPYRILIQDIWYYIQDLSAECGIQEFTVISDNLPGEVPVGTYSYLDINNSTFDIQYGKGRYE